jgi:deoxyribodipyrimidine photo-lyase
MANTPPSAPALVWFRRDLRVHDQPALAAALAHASVLPLFVIDDALLNGRAASVNRTWFMLESLRGLDAALRERGSHLVVRRGRPSDVVPAVAASCGATDVYISRDYSPYARCRDAAVARALAARGAALHARPGTLIVEPEAIANGDGRSISVYSPFRRRWERQPRRSMLSAPAALPPTPGVEALDLPSLADLEVHAPASGLIEPGEPAARRRLDAWAQGAGLDAYKAKRDLLGENGTSRLSQDLRWGLLSPLEVETRCAGSSEGRTSYISEIAWREFYYHVLWHNPHVTRRAFQPRYDNLHFDNDPTLADAWRRGRTGYPIVDAAMRQLLTTGWMHNRARMIAASFLTKDLLIDWRIGEAHFMAHLTDGDLASNNGGWQWASSTGTDPQPYFRIFNPVLQGMRFDASGAYVRRFVPELRAVPADRIHEPWTMSAEEQEAADCVIGRDYPAPVIDHAVARERALALYSATRS